MADHCGEQHCGAHSGQEEKIHSVSGKMNLVLWLLGILITIIMALGAALYGSVQALNISLASFSAKFSTIEARIQSLEVSDQRMVDRVDRLERKR